MPQAECRRPSPEILLVYCLQRKTRSLHSDVPRHRPRFCLRDRRERLEGDWTLLFLAGAQVQMPQVRYPKLDFVSRTAFRNVAVRLRRQRYSDSLRDPQKEMLAHTSV